ncbi:putative Glycosyl transferase, group 4; undecaprenyl-phosphate N-acetylglucosaminyl 1-phosphate transferase [Bradyrhizobium sp. STM 3843]|nr:putative Glycosyl transferase, group 4; undecaprenyl-phosphate N-acetylglucosaminyl 1-phosphate transferase [Bradyrhizobium sp. STM 3843]
MMMTIADIIMLLLAAIATAVVCTVLMVALRPLLQRYALARPNARSSHKVPTPQGAGIAVIAATLLIGGGYALTAGAAPPALLFVAAPLIALVGLVDDIRPIPVLPRLLLQALAVGLVVFAAPDDLRILPIPLAIERTLLLIGGLWFVNLVNFMDGLDLMTVAEAVPITAALAALGVAGLLPPPATIIAATLCGALLGFAPFNRPVAKVFLGDVGSLPIGLLLGWCLLELAWHGHVVAALLLPLYYLADATLTLLRRMLRGEPFWAAHRTHFYQRATDNGFTVTQVVGEVFLLNLVLAGLSGASIVSASMSAGLMLLIIGVAAVALVLRRFSQPREARASRGG